MALKLRKVLNYFCVFEVNNCCNGDSIRSSAVHPTTEMCFFSLSARDGPKAVLHTFQLIVQARHRTTCMVANQHTHGHIPKNHKIQWDSCRSGWQRWCRIHHAHSCCRDHPVTWQKQSQQSFMKQNISLAVPADGLWFLGVFKALVLLYEALKHWRIVYLCHWQPAVFLL